MDEKKKELLKEILFSPLQDLHGKKRYLRLLLAVVLAIPIYYGLVFASHRLSQEAFPVFVLLLVLVLLLVGLVVSKYVKTTKGDKNDQKSRP